MFSYKMFHILLFKIQFPVKYHIIRYTQAFQGFGLEDSWLVAFG